ncbi:hypothetical protein ABE442_22665 [Brevibacillus agri]|uniref:hypothetical protein n=1 Tax=Brevibacillus agri TaxID=51101 RepID=UPI0002A4F68C|nr:hypothetical protein [Brevibacillus agri]ELK39256.1 hypothetical protein D478_25288 [Brevibacillus agri BAB-2500]MED3498495.1 hypothetical protein [Brevibacillus agri]
MSKKLFKASLVSMLSVGISVSSLFFSSPIQAKQNPSTSDELLQYANEQNVNILLYDENGKIDKEFHVDGLEVTYKYKNGKMIESEDNKGRKQKYVKRDNYVEVTEYENGKELFKHALSSNDLKFPEVKTNEHENLEKEKMEEGNKKGAESDLRSIGIESTTTYEDYYVNGVLMNNLVPGSCPCSSGSDKFINYSSMTESEIQSFFQNKNSILKDPVQIWRRDSNGNVYNTNKTILPSKAIYNAAQTHRMNPKVVIATLQKEQSLVSAAPGSVSYSSRRFYYAMGYGATDGGDLNGTSGFDIQIDKGTKLFKDLWYNSPTETYPILFNNINYGKTVTSNGVTYKNYIWVKNYGTWALYKYTPHALDINYLPTITGGNYSFQSIFKSYWGTDWD